VPDVVILGGGPGGYEAALIAARAGADTVVVEDTGIGGATVLTDVVPSKSLIAVASTMFAAGDAGSLGVRYDGEAPHPDRISASLGLVNERIRGLATQQAADTEQRLVRTGVTVLRGRGRLTGSDTIAVERTDGGAEELSAGTILVATGASPRELPDARPDGRRILTWKQLYDLEELPDHLIVVGSGVTGAEFASGFRGLGAPVTLVSSRDRLLPHEDADAARVIEDVFGHRGIAVVSRARASAATVVGDGVVVSLADGREIEGSHCLMAVGSIPNTSDIGLAEAGIRTDEHGFVMVDRVSRTSARGVYAAGDCTGKLMLASVAAMQGRVAMWHALGMEVHPLNTTKVASNVFTDPEIASVGCSQQDVDSGTINAVSISVPLGTNARAKMIGLRHGFVKLFARPSTHIVVGGVVVAPHASELIYPISIAVDQGLSLAQLGQTFTIYPSLSGSIAEAALRLEASDATP